VFGANGLTAQLGHSLLQDARSPRGKRRDRLGKPLKSADSRP
jgi:hypothetical protein